MKAKELSSFQSFQNRSFLDHALKSKGSSEGLSEAEEKMISRKFSDTTLSIYEESGSVSEKQPSARGSKFDATI